MSKKCHNCGTVLTLPQKKAPTRDELIAKFNKLSYKKKNAILWEAINYMQSYNGRSVTDCVVLAMGG